MPAPKNLRDAPTRTAIYRRISDDPTGQQLGVGRQGEDCMDLADQLGWEVHEVYTDNDISATSGRPRPQYRRMLNDLDAGLAQAIIAWHPDRLYRRVPDLADLIDVCKRNNIQVATVNAGHIDLSTASGRMVAGMLAQVATYEGEHKAERWNRSYRQARESGRLPKFGHRMFGWTRDGELVDTEADIIRSMADDVLAGVPVRGICRRLNDEGVLTSRGNAWQPATVRNLLRNPRLAGHSTTGHWEEFREGDRKRRRRRTEIVGDGQWEPILDRQTWETVRSLLSARSTPQPVRVSLLPGLILCGVCEQPLITGSHKNGPRAYRCVRRPDAPSACGGVIGTADPIERIVESYAQRWLDDSRVRENIARLRSLGSGAATELDALQSRLVEIEAALREPGQSVQALLRAADSVRERMAELQRRARAAAAPKTLPRSTTWPTDLGKRRRLVDLVVARVWLDPAPAMGGRFCEERVRVDPVEG